MNARLRPAPVSSTARALLPSRAMRNLLRFLLIGASLTGCAQSPPPPDPPPDDPLVAPAPGDGIQIAMQTTIDAGVETYGCRFFVAPPGLNIVRQVVRYTPGSHHVLLYRTPYQTIPTVDGGGHADDFGQAHICAGGAPVNWLIDGVVAGAQDATAPETAMPDGVALRVPAGAVLLMETHYLNASPRGVIADARINLYTIPDGAVQTEAGVIFFYDPYIRVPAGGTATARMRCPVRRDERLLAAQSHMHRRGIGYQADLLDGDGRLIETLYRNDDWQNVPVAVWPAGEPLAAGRFIDYHCDYANSENRVVDQGLTTTDEMCMFLGVYYPVDRPFELCGTTDDFYGFSSAGVFVGNGSNACAAALSCVDGADGQGAIAGCIEASCPAAAA